MNKPVYLIFSFLIAGSVLTAQQKNIDTLLRNAEKAQLSYRFKEAVSLYKQVYDASADSTIRKKVLSEITHCENGSALLEYGVKPEVIGSTTLSFRDFFLYYQGMADSSWCIVPQNLSKVSANVSPRSVVYLRNGDSEIIYSAKNRDGRWKLFSIRQIDGSRWSAPKALNSEVNSPGDEIFPYLSKDGRELYFSSNGHFGIGGFDLYVSIRDEKSGEWGTPQNLGFPFSSPKNDYLFVNSDDGSFTFLASDRSNSNPDSVSIYALARDITPVKRSFTDYSEIISTASLSLDKIDTSAGEGNKQPLTSENSDEYSAMVLKIRNLQNQVDSFIKTIASNRSLYESLTNDADKKLLESKIAENELKLISLQSELRGASAELQKLEMAFLEKGMLVPRVTSSQISSDGAKKTTAYNPARNSLGRFPDLILEKPYTPFNYTFRTEPVSVVAPFDSIPGGIVFTAQLFLSSDKADVKRFKGLLPIFEDITPTGKYLYFCGAFSTYESAVEAIAKIKKSGFPGAIVSAFNNRKSTPLKSARTLAAQRDKNLGFRVILEDYADTGLPQQLIDLIRSNSEKDIAKTVKDGRTIYFIGTFSKREDAEKLLNILQNAGTTGASVEGFSLQQ